MVRCAMRKVIIDIERVLTDKGISKNQLCYACKIQRTQLNNYCKNNVTRIDLHTIEKICNYMNCEVGDILRLEKEEENN